MPEPSRLAILAEPLRPGANSPRCTIVCRLAIFACVGLALVVSMLHGAFREPVVAMDDRQQQGGGPSQLFVQSMARSLQHMHSSSARNIVPPGFRGLLFARSGNTEKAGLPKAMASNDAGPVISLHPAAVPSIRKAGPAEIESEQADMLRALMNEKHSVFDSSLDRTLGELSDERDEEERQEQKLQRTEDESDFDVAFRKRKGEIRRTGRQLIVTELLYLKTCMKFKQKGVPMVPSLKTGGDALFGAIDSEAFTTEVHTEGATKLIMQRLFDTFGPKILAAPATDASREVVKIALLEAARTYSEFCVVGYSLRSANRRFQLHKIMGNVVAQGELDSENRANAFAENGRTTHSLKHYMSSIGPDELDRMSKIDSVEARSALELQVAALFGDLSALTDEYHNALRVGTQEGHHHDLGQAIEDGEVQSIRLTTEDLARLMLEAAAFGALLNDAEKQISSIYELTPLRKKAAH